MEGESEHVYPPTNSQQMVSDDDEIYFSVKPEFYDLNLDDQDELWVQNKRKVVAQMLCLATQLVLPPFLLECQRHEKYVTQYRAIFTVSCKIESQARPITPKQKRGKRRRDCRLTV